MPTPLILATGSAIRQHLFRQAGVSFDVHVARVDEHSLREAMLAARAKPRDIADALAEAKAKKVSGKHPGRLVLGCDQILWFDGQILSKPESVDDARQQLRSLSGQTHDLFSAAVIYDDTKPVWRHVGQVRLRMRNITDDYLNGYLDRNWDSIQHSVGGYKLEEEGVRLFERIEGDHFNVLGVPMLETLSYLTLRGFIEG